MRLQPLRILATLTLFGVAASAGAQMLPTEDSLVQFSRFTAVRDRRIPGYESVGVSLGSFKLSPVLDASTQYSDNLLAQADNKIGDVFFRVAPSAVLQSDWAQRSLTLSANGRFDRYTKYTSENVDAVDASAYGIQQFGDSTRLRAVVRYRNDRESRESQDVFALTDRPVHFQTGTAALALSQRFASFLLSGEAGATRYNYDDEGLMRGGTLDQDYRDHDLVRLRLRGEIAQSPALAYFAQLTRETTDYGGSTTSTGAVRGSTRYEILGGARFELPIGARGEVGIGYVKANFEAVGYSSFTGFAINSRVLFFPTELTTVTITANRNVNDSGVLNSTGYVALRGGVTVDHELLRNLILNAGLQYERDKFNGVDRRDGRLGGVVGAEYRIGRSWWLNVSYEYFDLSSRGFDQYRSFARNRVTAGIRFRV